MNRRDLIVAAVAATLTSAGLAAQSPSPADPHAILFGTVFNDSHFVIEGARIVAYNQASPKKKYRAVTNYRGEYRIRVPAGNGTYVVSASAPKFARSERTVEVYGIDKSTANLILEPRKKRKSAPAASKTGLG